ncbi:DUF317 domain-containing protein [Streptacidiphilus neutrinimicus]|uniref:DUF317 domain-containing protein n=1 Tax=Streptacidiphilus neutrinimicus TaxID=105420 RepID=UPI0005A70C1C|nr:DUF317 domain-containing protein [Streptacidiphilus neutrinimicus]
MTATSSMPTPDEPGPALDFPLLTVRPRYLAGPGQPDAALDRLDIPGWSWFDDDSANCHTFSPCQRLYAGFLPEPGIRPGRELWRIWARPHRKAPLAWSFSANSNIPAELVGTLGTALAHDWHRTSPDAEATIGEPPAFLAGPGDTDLVWSVLYERGWVVIGGGPDGSDAFARDGQARLSHRPHQDGTPGQRAWTATATPGLDGQPIWTATFTAQTPAHYIAAFADALADPDGLIREPHQLDRRLWQSHHLDISNVSA